MNINKIKIWQISPKIYTKKYFFDIIVNEKGEWVVEPQYVEADCLLDGSWVVKLENNKHQVIGNDGNIIVNEF